MKLGLLENIFSCRLFSLSLFNPVRVKCCFYGPNTGIIISLILFQNNYFFLLIGEFANSSFV